MPLEDVLFMRFVITMLVLFTIGSALYAAIRSVRRDIRDGVAPLKNGNVSDEVVLAKLEELCAGLAEARRGGESGNADQGSNQAAP